jgi:hypothetical protein
MAVVAVMGNRSVFPFDEVGIPPSEPGYGFLSPIVAPVDGIASQRSAEIGGRISQGQQLIVVVQIDNVWTTANFKETQLRKMHVGQRVTIEVDSLDESFDGAVEFMPAATGDRSSLFPPENATGNYVKIVQRLPCGYASTRISATWISCAPACPSSPRFTWIDDDLFSNREGTKRWRINLSKITESSAICVRLPW